MNDTDHSVSATIQGDGKIGGGAQANFQVLMETHYHVVCRDKHGNVKWVEDCHNRVVTAGLNKLLDATFKTGLTTPLWYVGVCAPSVTDGVMTNASPNLASASTPFLAADATRSILVRGALTGNKDLATTISTFTDTGHVVLAANCTNPANLANGAVIVEARAGDTMASHSPWLESSAYSEANRQTFTPGTITSGSVDNSASPAVITCNADNTLIGGMFLTDNNTKGGTTGTLYGMAPFTKSFRQMDISDTLSITATVTSTAT